MFNYLTTNDFKLNVIDAEDPEAKKTYRISLKFLYRISLQITIIFTQVSDYNTQPEVSLLAEEAKACLQETEEVPRDITSLFDNSLFKLDTSLVPKVLG